jgi:hypothetical protein
MSPEPEDKNSALQSLAATVSGSEIRIKIKIKIKTQKKNTDNAPRIALIHPVLCRSALIFIPF